MLPLRWLKITPVIGLCLLTGCLKAPYNNYKSTSTTRAYTVAGASSGAAIGSLMGSTPIGAATGGLLGLARGNYVNSVKGLTQELRNAGIAIYPEKDQMTVLIPTDNFYEINRPKLRTNRYQALNQLSTFISHFHPEGDIYVAGFTDNVGTTLHQRQYSMQLAEEMAGFLWAHGINGRDLHVEGYGSKHSIADNNTVRGNAMNRRVEIQWRPRANIPLVIKPKKQIHQQQMVMRSK